jgi:cyclopropane fatty-acyl-phospholipid synthase-like methyltransferase
MMNRRDSEDAGQMAEQTAGNAAESLPGTDIEASDDFALLPVKAFQGSASAYYADAERFIEAQWSGTIWPLIKEFDFRVTLDFACGQGRNTALLARHAKELYAVDANPAAVAAAKKRFEKTGTPVKVLLNNGRDLSAIPSGVITALYSFDSMVHFEKRLMETYMPEFARVMAPGAKGFIHHSNLGRLSDNPDFTPHPGWRSNVEKEWFARCCWNHGLWPIEQTPLTWHVGQCLFQHLDCLTIIYNPTPA